MRTITTNHTNADMSIMDQDMKDVFVKAMAETKKDLMQTLFDDGVMSWKKPIVHRRVDRVETRKRMVSYPNGYWAKIEIKDNDHVSYKVFNSGWLAKTFNKIGFRKVLVNGWDSVKQRDTVEATLGATYMAIDEAIATDESSASHSTFLKEMIKTDPENLKAIAQLDMLDKGDGPGADATSGMIPESGSSAAGITPAMAAPMYGQNIAVSGSGAYFTKDDPTQPASISVGPIAFAKSPTVLTFGNGEEDIKVDPDGSVSFGDKMVKAIKSVVEEPTEEPTTEKGEVDDSQSSY